MSAGGWEAHLQRAVDRLMPRLACHWLSLLTALFAAVLILAYAPPLLHAAGWHGPARLVFHGFSRFCHQLPERSTFLLGEQVALCQRDIGTYLGLVLGGVVFGASRGRVALRSWKAFLVLAVLPMALDGGTQLVGLRESTPLLRLVTGMLLGAGIALFTYPRLARPMRELGAGPP